MKTMKIVGFTLLELLVAMAIGLGVLAGVVSLLVATSASYSAQRQNAYIQENIRTILEVVGRELRLTAHESLAIQRTKTMTATEWNLHDSGGVLSSGMFSAKPGVRAHEAATRGWTPALPRQLTSLSVPPVAGSDVLIVTYREPIELARIDADQVNAQDGNTIELTLMRDDLVIHEGAMLAIEAGIGDVPGDIFVNQTAVNGSKAILTKPAGRLWQIAYDRKAYLYRHKVVAYYVGRPEGVNRRSGLYQFVLGEADPVALIDDIENLQLQFKLRTDSAAVWTSALTRGGYASANVINQQRIADVWQEVDAIKLGLLFRGDGNDASASRPTAHKMQIIPNATDSEVIIPANTPVRYQAITTVIAVRNNL